MFADILNRPWKVSPAQGVALVRDGLSRRKFMFRGALTSAGVVLAAYGGMGSSCGIDLSTLTPEIVGYVQNIGAALTAALTSLGSMTSALPAGWAQTLTTLGGYVSQIQQIASSISTATLVSTAGGAIANFVTDFNNIVNAIVNSPAVVALVSATGFGWALSAASILLPLIEQAVNVVINIVSPPAPVPAPVAMAAHRAMTTRFTAALDPATANAILQAIAAGNATGSWNRPVVVPVN
jgi:hypothetical protein